MASCCYRCATDSLQSNCIEYVSTVGPRDLASKIIDSLITDEAKTSIISAIQGEQNLSPESALERYNERLGSAKSELESSLKPLFEGIADQLFSTELPEAEARAGNQDPNNPIKRLGDGIKTFRERIESYVDNLPDFEGIEGLKKMPISMRFAKLSDIVNADAGQSLGNTLKRVN